MLTATPVFFFRSEMILSLLLRNTLLFLVADHSIAQEWYTQDNYYGPDFYSPSLVKDAPPSYLEKREADISANESKLVYPPDYPSNVRQKRDLDDADNEQHSSDVTNDISGYVDELPNSNVQSIDPNSYPDINNQKVSNDSYEYANSDTSSSYEYPQSDANSDVNSETNGDANIVANGVTNSVTVSDANIVTNSETNFHGHETTDQRLEDRANDVMDDKDEPADYGDSSDTATASNNEVMQEGSGESSFQADDSHLINKEENHNKPEEEHAVETDENDQRTIVAKKQKEKETATSSSTTTSSNEDGSGSFRRQEEHGDDDDDDDEWAKDDEDEDEQPVKRQNLGINLRSSSYQYFATQ